MTDAHLKVGAWEDTATVKVNEHGEKYRKQYSIRESIYCRVKTLIKFYRWVKVAE